MCDLNCFSCTRPASKCHGGNQKTAITDPALRAVHKPKDGPAEGIKAAHSRGVKRHHGSKGRLW